jgi:hypothetical protein
VDPQRLILIDAGPSRSVCGPKVDFYPVNLRSVIQAEAERQDTLSGEAVRFSWQTFTSFNFFLAAGVCHLSFWVCRGSTREGAQAARSRFIASSTSAISPRSSPEFRPASHARDLAAQCEKLTIAAAIADWLSSSAPPLY